MGERFSRYQPDMDSFNCERRAGPCFVCEVGAERMHLYTFCSNQGGAHVHWYVVALPAGVSNEDQQGVWVGWGMGCLTTRNNVSPMVFADPQREKLTAEG